jgi:hypothetical protein
MGAQSRRSVWLFSLPQGAVAYQFHRVRLHGVTERLPNSFRYRITERGLHGALSFTRLYNRALRSAAPAAARRAEKRCLWHVLYLTSKPPIAASRRKPGHVLLFAAGMPRKSCASASTALAASASRKPASTAVGLLTRRSLSYARWPAVGPIRIAASLNRMGMPTGQGKTWTAHRVSSLGRVRGIHDYRSAEKNGEWLAMSHAAAKLSVSHHQVRKLINPVPP